MNLIDLCAHVGSETRRPIGLDAEGLARLLEPFGITEVHAGRLEALWFENPHDANRLPGGSSKGRVAVVPVPVLDPTIPTWPEELDRLAGLGRLPLVRLLPNYHGYSLTEADALLAALAKRKVIAQVLVRMDDPRRQHRLAQVPDVPAASVRDAAERHPTLSVLLSGALIRDLNILANRLPTARNLWADTSQADGLDAVPSLMRSAWRDRLVFATHAPLFIPYSAVARVVLDLDDEAVTRIVQDNPRTLLG
jgi:hypothetical protein